MKTVKSILFNALLATIPFLIICGLPLTALKVCAETIEIEVNTEVSGCVYSDSNTCDLYRFSVDKPGRFNILVKRNSEPTQDLVYLEFSKEQKGIESKAYWDNNRDEYVFWGDIMVPGEVGEICFSTQADYYSYTFTVLFYEDVVAPETYEIENNDTIEYANPIDLGRGYEASLGVLDKDWYSFMVTEEGYLWVEVYTFMPHLYKEGSDSEIIERPRCGGYHKEFVEPGNYYLMISDEHIWEESRMNRDGNYHLTLQFLPASEITWRSMYRLYNPNSGEHFWTGSTEERDDLVKAGWNYEGHGWDAPVEEGEPVYRFYNATLGDHHYTKDPDEIAYLNASDGWTCEGVCWNSASEETGVPLYRLYNPNAYAEGTAGAHHYTQSGYERANLIRAGWIDEGIGWYAEKE